MGLLDNTQKAATAKNARELIIFADPKVGKTELLTKLEENLILDFEGGTDYYDANAVSIPDLATFNLVRDEFVTSGKRFKYISIDTLTSLYANIINEIAVQMYNKDENKKKAASFDMTTLAYGVGYAYKRNALQKVISFFRQYCNCLILVGHTADKAMGDENQSIQDIDIEGKLKNILALKTDAVALMKRSKPNENVLSFTNVAGTVSGTRVQHLAGKEITISKKLEDGTLETYWDQIFI